MTESDTPPPSLAALYGRMTPGPLSREGANGVVWVETTGTGNGGVIIAKFEGRDRVHNAEGYVAAHRLLAYLAGEGAEARAKIKALVESSLASPASGPVAWTDEKIAAAHKQADSLTDAIIHLLEAVAMGSEHE